MVDATVFKTDTLQGLWVRVPTGATTFTEAAMSRAPNMKDMRERLNTIKGEIAVLRGQEALLLEMMNEAPKEPAAKRAARGQ